MTEQDRLTEFRRLEAEINDPDLLRALLLGMRDSAYSAAPPPDDREGET